MEVKLPRHILKQLHGQQFDVKILEVEDIFKAIHSGPPISKDPHTESHDSHFLSSSKIWLGPMLSRVILDRQKDYILSPLAHTQALKVGSRNSRSIERLSKELPVFPHGALLRQSTERFDESEF